MARVVLSSGNKHKISEIKSILRDFDLEVISKNDIGYKDFEVEEDGDTLEENSMKKAMELWKKTGDIVIADDTGLFVEYLDGEPGVYSARYAGEDATYDDNNKLLLQKLENVPADKRKAYFKTVVSIIDSEGASFSVEGICKGEIGFEPVGDNGFGYDPIFIVEGLDKTFAQLTDIEKNKYSHRGKAVRNLKNIIGEILK
ncbi:XTP/dITP diphosphohydrolase [Dethiosulfatibacter aminovorans DSM 17477]|uniref:dITP/XTP pyrophosphatase n=1 Tax=Dethiosulfatibacter aminovorans DSM 17477 TaxID=1121476 RepID=A0A1M6FWQ8_9FIRM|nr:RdgB/HAM1 family non-canonical purine NTP pyrophosphatase [Dethiosulfatibacter aminovorans]SHJ02171.1 XTP/dITP diphosphohydrolase [Dethiosulfatibacter aminovorans DSM 17477]